MVEYELLNWMDLSYLVKQELVVAGGIEIGVLFKARADIVDEVFGRTLTIKFLLHKVILGSCSVNLHYSSLHSKHYQQLINSTIHHQHYFVKQPVTIKVYRYSRSTNNNSSSDLNTSEDPKVFGEEKSKRNVYSVIFMNIL